MSDDPRVEAVFYVISAYIHEHVSPESIERIAAAALAAADAAAWRPISEAPQDGTEVLVWAPYDGVVSSKFKHGCWQKLTVVFGRGESNNDPTHFRHLPTPPQETES